MFIRARTSSQQSRLPRCRGKRVETSPASTTMMRHALGVLFACAGALALDETAGSDVSVSARLVLATDFDAATFNADWYARVPLRRALARLVSDGAGVCVQWWQDGRTAWRTRRGAHGAGHAVDVTVRARAAGAVSDARRTPIPDVRPRPRDGGGGRRLARRDDPRGRARGRRRARRARRRDLAARRGRRRRRRVARGARARKWACVACSSR